MGQATCWWLRASDPENHIRCWVSVSLTNPPKTFRFFQNSEFPMSQGEFASLCRRSTFGESGVWTMFFEKGPGPEPQVPCEKGGRGTLCWRLKKKKSPPPPGHSRRSLCHHHRTFPPSAGLSRRWSELSKGWVFLQRWAFLLVSLQRGAPKKDRHTHQTGGACTF